MRYATARRASTNPFCGFPPLIWNSDESGRIRNEASPRANSTMTGMSDVISLEGPVERIDGKLAL